MVPRTSGSRVKTNPRDDSPGGGAVPGAFSSTVDEGTLDDETDDNVRSRDFVQSLERGLAIIRVFNAEQPSMTVSEIAQQVGLTRAAVRRFLLTLGELGYVYARNNRFELTPRVLELGYAYLSALSFPDIALPRLEQLVAETGEASEGSILYGGDVVYVVRVPGPALMTISVNCSPTCRLRISTRISTRIRLSRCCRAPSPTSTRCEPSSTGSARTATRS
jgi:DNA-binding transcriptional ArsR family regulator